MLVFLISYILAVIITNYVIYKRKYNSKPFPKLKLTKFGIEFFSYKRHKVKVDSNVVIICQSVYINNGKQIVIIKNVKNVVKKNNYLFFTSNGKIIIELDCGDLYKYFNLKIVSDYIDFESMKQLALMDVLKNEFDINKSIYVRKYLNFIKNTLNIQINADNISVNANKLKISYQLIYKLNGKIKKINVSNTIGKI